MAGESLKNYKDSVFPVIQDQNPTKPAQKPVSGGRQDSVTAGSVFASSPTVNWNGYNTYDSILANNSIFNTNTTSTSKAQKLAKTGTIIAASTAGLGIAFSLGSMIAGIVQNRKEAKAANNASSGITSESTSLLDKAKSLSNSVDLDELIQTSSDLQTQITSLEQQASAASETEISKASKNVETLKQQKTDYSYQKKTVAEAEGNFATAVNDYTDIKGKYEAAQKKLPKDDSDPNYSTIKAEIDNLKKEMDSAKKKMQDLEKTYKEAQSKLSNMPNPTDAEINEAKQNLEKLKSIHNKVPKQIEKLENQKEKIDSRIEALKVAQNNDDQNTESA